MKTCLLCETPIYEHWDYCTRCYQKTISELEEEMEKKEGPFAADQDVEEAPASNPLMEKPTTP